MHKRGGTLTGQLTNGRWAAVSGLSEMIFLTKKATSKGRLPSFMQILLTSYVKKQLEIYDK
jgi:hypothetical protein